jgi:hypothetical protein
LLALSTAFVSRCLCAPLDGKKGKSWIGSVISTDSQQVVDCSDSQL